MSISLICNSKSVGVNSQHKTLGTTSHHYSQCRSNIESPDARVLVFSPVLVVILPHLVEVERVEELDRSIECGHDKADVLDVSELRDGVLGSLFRFKIRFSSSGAIGDTPFLRLHVHIEAGLLIAHRTHILELVL